jgi:hypothetical protein
VGAAAAAAAARADPVCAWTLSTAWTEMDGFAFYVRVCLLAFSTSCLALDVLMSYSRCVSLHHVTWARSAFICSFLAGKPLNSGILLSPPEDIKFRRTNLMRDPHLEQVR